MVCRGCSRRLDEAANAMRAHANVMRQALDLSRDGSMVEELRQDLTTRLKSTRLKSSFNDAQSAWDAYRQHMIEDGYLPAALKSLVMLAD